MNDALKPKPKGRGCLFYLLMICLALLLVVSVALYLGYRAARSFVHSYTSDQPIVLPPIELEQPEIAATRKRMDDFRAALAAGRAAGPLTLNASDLNGLLAGAPGWGDKVRLAVVSNELQAQMSVPLSQIGLRFFKDRYLNGTASLKAAIENGALVVGVSSIAVNGKPLPETYLARIRQENFAEVLNADTNLAAVFQQLQAIRIEDGKLTVSPKPAP